MLLNPLLRSSADLVIKQIEYEKKLALVSEADRAFELIGRAIRMAGYRNIARPQVSQHPLLEIRLKTGFKGSDSLTVRHDISDGMDFDCVGNVITKERMQNHLALQGFLVDRQAGAPKGKKINGGSLICQSLDRQGRIQNTTLMNGVDRLIIEELKGAQALHSSGQRLFRVGLQMTDGGKIHLQLERTFATRNLL
jgi:hypothetical protein